ncbi:outer membrane protein assembly factor BamB [Novosphingobium kunmingense]|uniref:Outer membrane protein assembly factor BamB n=1 Tax=Novosphingobium kunmingense TaxID=1211806 RepID=A0A2N0I428_9SPHN|nr:PQQ-like beta-propeller repeat protein [Novosphingobium kunmingense]PKB25952.1 outer membrane protein assembly factor BamB [Novosphingobium kunmingense]
MPSISIFRKGAAPLALVLALGLSGCGVFGGKGKPSTPTVGDRVAILSRVESGAKVDPALDGVAVVLPPAAVNADWPQAGGNAGKSYGNLALSATPAQIWTGAIAGSGKKQRLAASPVVGGGQLFAMGTDGVVTAFDAGTGARRWSQSFSVKGDAASSVYGGGASYNDGKVYVTTGVGEVAALDASDGKQLWKVKPAGPLRGSPTIAFGSVYVMTMDNQIVSLNAADGTLQWNETGASGQTGVFGVAAPAAGQGTVITGYSTGELVAYRYENGRQLWADALARTSLSTSVGVLTDIDADPIIDRGRVFALGQGGRMAAYELVSGQRIWELNLAGISTPAVAGDWIFTLTDDAKLLCIARSNGKVRWVQQLTRFGNEEKKSDPVFWTGPVLAGDRLWFANSNGEIYSAGVADGAPQLVTRTKAAVSLSPVVANSTLYVLDDDGTITALR